METEPSKSKKNNYWILSAVAFSFVIVFLVFSWQENKSEKASKKFSRHSQREQYYNDRKQDDNENQNYSNSNQAFYQKGYLSNKDIKELKHWGFEASDVPDLKAKKRSGVVNTLSVDGETGKGSCSELVIILKKSPHVSADDLSSMKINQSTAFADTRNSNDVVIRFAVAKIVEKGHKWEHDVYVMKANSDATTISGPSAGSGVYMALLSAFYSDCPIPKNLAITGEFKTEREEIPTKIESSPKKYQWRADHCAHCGKYSWTYHFIYDRITHEFEKKHSENATNPDSQWVFCTWKCYNEWWGKNVYNCSECGRQRFGNCSCCGNYHFWIWEKKDNGRFCSEKCINKRHPKEHKEGKIVAIGSISGKVSAAVEKGCDTLIISKGNSSDYHDEVPLSVQTKVKILHEVESYQDLEKLLTT